MAAPPRRWLTALALPTLIHAQGFRNSPPPPPPPLPPFPCEVGEELTGSPDIKYDLSLAAAAQKKNMEIVAADNHFYVRICQPPDKAACVPCPNSPCDPLSCGDPSCVALPSAIATFPGGSATCAASGNFNTGQWNLQDPNNPEGGVMLNFTGGDGGRSMGLVFKCDWGQNSPKSGGAVENPTLHYEITVITSGACAIVPLPMTGGWIFIIVFLSCTVAYCIGFAIYNIKVKGEEGMNIIPHWAYWRYLPYLVKEGCIFTYKHGGRAIKNAPRDIKEWWAGRNNKELKEPIAYTPAVE